MKLRVEQLRWNNELEALVPVPLDDADDDTIKLASFVHGRDVTPQEVQRFMQSLGYTISLRGY